MTHDTNALARLIDEASIRSATARFADAATRGDYAGFASVWSPDAEWMIGDPPQVHARGVGEIVATLEHLRTGKEFFVQFAVQGVIVIDGDHATTTCLCHESARGPGETYYRNHCVAFDRLVRSGDGWVFSKRSFQYLWLDTSAFGGQSFPLPTGYADAP